MYAMKPVKLTPSASQVKHADVKGSLVGKKYLDKSKRPSNNKRGEHHMAQICQELNVLIRLFLRVVTSQKKEFLYKGSIGCCEVEHLKKTA